MISQEEFARQLQLSDPQTVAGVFSYFQKVRELGCNMQSSGFKDVRVAMSSHCMASLESGLDILTAVVRWPSSEVCWGILSFIEYPVHCRAVF